jgi:hypothetical protein
VCLYRGTGVSERWHGVAESGCCFRFASGLERNIAKIGIQQDAEAEDRGPGAHDALMVNDRVLEGNGIVSHHNPSCG